MISKGPSNRTIVVLSALTVLLSTASVLKHRGTKYTATEIVDACFKKNIAMCGDLICEGDDEPEAILSAMHNAMRHCLARPDLIGKEWFK